MRALKALVIFMGILIVIGMGGLAYGLMVKFNKNNNDVEKAPVMPISADMLNIIPAANMAGEVFGEVDALLPAGAKIIKFIANGQRLLIIYQNSSKLRAIKVINVANGNDMGIIYLDKANDSEGNQ